MGYAYGFKPYSFHASTIILYKTSYSIVFMDLFHLDMFQIWIAYLGYILEHLL